MATKGEVLPEDATKEFSAEKIRMKTAKATMTRAVKRLETAINDYSEFKDLKIDNKDYVAVSREVSESLEEAKAAYKKMESINDRLEELVVILNDLGKVPELDKILADLGDALEQYWSKYEAVRASNKLILMEVEVTMRPLAGTQVVSNPNSESEFVRFNPATDTRPSYLERESSMLETLAWIDQATYYIRSGFKNKPPQSGALVHLQSLINPTWLQSIEALGAKNKKLEDIMTLIKLEAETRDPLHGRRMALLKLALGKKTGKHSDHLMRLERHMEVIDWENMTKDQFLIHLFAESCSCNVMSKLSMEVLSSNTPTVAELRKKISQTENSLWYSSSQNLGKFAGSGGTPGQRYCKPCDSTTHWESQCYGVCRFCGKRGHREEWCRNKDQTPATPATEPEQANAVTEIKKKKKKKKKNKKKANKVEGPEVGEQPQVSESESESESPNRGDVEDPNNARANRVFSANKAMKTKFNSELSGMDPEIVKEMLRAMRAAKDSSPMTITNMYRDVKGKTGIQVNTCWDSGCTFPIASLEVVNQLKAKIWPLTQSLTIVEASGSPLTLLGTASIFIESDVLGDGRKEIECAIIQGTEGTKEVLISLRLMKNWGMIHESFPHETIDAFYKRVYESEIYDRSYLSYYSVESSVSKPLPPPSKQCQLLKEKILSKWKDIFKNKLDKSDRVSIPPVNLSLKPGSVPVYNSRPFDCPYHLRRSYDEELKDMIDADLIEPMGLKESPWCSRAFPVLKGDKQSVRIVSDFKAVNRCLTRPTHPTDSAQQLLRQIKPTSRYFATIDCTSGYSQIPISEASSDLLVISTTAGRFRMKVLGQGICSASDIFNVVTDGSTRLDDNVVKNMDDIMFFSESLRDLEKVVCEFLKFCKQKNLKLKTDKFRISEHVEFAGATINSELVRGERVVNILPKDGRIMAFQDLKKPENKSELRSFCGMVSSLSSWTPNVNINMHLLRKNCSKNGKIQWTQELEEEYQTVKEIMKTQFKLSPFDADKKIYLVIDGSSRVGTGYCMLQRICETDPAKGFLIISTGASLLPTTKGEYSPIEAEMIALDRACTSCDHWLRYAEINLISDCTGLLYLLDKDLCEIKNRRLQNILERVQVYNWKTEHISSDKNKVCDALSRLCKSISGYSRYYPNDPPRLLNLSKRLAKHVKELEIFDPLVQEMAEMASLDEDYLLMLTQLENKVQISEMSESSELRSYSGCKDEIWVTEVAGGHRLIMKGSEIIVPKSLRSRMLDNLHITHSSDSQMILQAKNKIAWPNIKEEIRRHYKSCQECLEFRRSKAQQNTEISYENVFERFEPGQFIQCDYAEYGGQDYHLIADEISGFFRVTKCKSKSTKEAIRSIREWASVFSKPYRCKVDNGPSYREEFAQECKSLGIDVIHSSCYNSESQGLIERKVQVLKNLLKKSGSSLSQLQLDELIFEVNAREEQGNKGSALTRFMGRGLRTKLPNSVDRSVNFKDLIKKRKDEREKRVKKGGRTEEKKLIFNIGEVVRLQCPKSKAWDSRGEIKALRYSETGKIVSYDILLPNGKVTSRHRRFLTRDIPDIDDTEIPEGPNDEGLGTPENEGTVESGHSSGAVTRSRSRFIGKLAMSTCGKFLENDDLVTDDLAHKSRGADQVTEREVDSQGSLHSLGLTVGEMGGKSCVSLPCLCLGTYAVLSTVVIVCLSYFLHGCSGGSIMAPPQPVKCMQTGPSIQETNLDFLNLDISEKDIVDGARKVKCDCTWEVLEWTLFEILVVALLLIIFGYLFMSDGVSYLREYLKRRNTDEKRLQRELSELESKQNKLKKKMGKGGTAQAPTQPIGEAEQSLSAI